MTDAERARKWGLTADELEVSPTWHGTWIVCARKGWDDNQISSHLSKAEASAALAVLRRDMAELEAA